MKINNRLKKISEFINHNSFILDVGCDHALLDIYLVLNKKNIKAIASDVRSGPLEKAKENAKRYGVFDKIIFELHDGIENLNDKIDTIVISGMGATTIKDILEKDIDKITNQKIIISSNNEEELLRLFLNQHNFKIIDEVLVEDSNKIYPIMVFIKGKENLTEEKINYGPILLKNKDDIFNKYYQLKLNNLIEINNHLPLKQIIKKIKLNKKIREIRKIL